MEFSIDMTSQLNFQINKDLATILISNLIRNVIVHGKQGTKVTLQINDRSIEIQNHGDQNTLDVNTMFTRFKKISVDK